MHLQIAFCQPCLKLGLDGLCLVLAPAVHQSVVCIPAIDRLLTAYQEELLSLDELRRRMPELRQREHALQTELNSILDQISDRAVFLRLAETLSGFLSRLRSSADTLDIQERQRIVRLVVSDILVGDETIVIRHSIPLSSMTPSGDGGVQSKSAAPPALVVEVTFCVQGVTTQPRHRCSTPPPAGRSARAPRSAGGHARGG
jgi:hypothetical protein